MEKVKKPNCFGCGLIPYECCTFIMWPADTRLCQSCSEVLRGDGSQEDTDKLMHTLAHEKIKDEV